MLQRNSFIKNIFMFLGFLSIIGLTSCGDKEPTFESGSRPHDATIRIYTYSLVGNRQVVAEGTDVAIYIDKLDRELNVKAVRRGKSDAQGHVGFYGLPHDYYYIKAISPLDSTKVIFDEIKTPDNTVSFLDIILK